MKICIFSWKKKKTEKRKEKAQINLQAYNNSNKKNNRDVCKHMKQFAEQNYTVKI